MTKRQYLVTLLHPLNGEIEHSKESVAKKLKESSSVFQSGALFKGAENSGGNALGCKYISAN